MHMWVSMVEQRFDRAGFPSFLLSKETRAGRVGFTAILFHFLDDLGSTVINHLPLLVLLGRLTLSLHIIMAIQSGTRTNPGKLSFLSLPAGKTLFPGTSLR